MAAKISEKDRIHIKELVVAGSSAQIQEALDANKLRRKRHKALEVDHDAKEIVFVVTTDTVDRDSERVLPKAFEKNMSYFEENPVVLFSHDHGMPAVGCVTETSISDEQVMQRVKFATDTGYPLADLLWNLYAADERFMRMCSIGFIPLEWSDEASDKLEGQTGLTYKEIEPIELSLVNIGANRYALSALPAKIRNDSVLKSVYEEIVETSEPEGGSSITVGATTTEGVLYTAKEEETIQMKNKRKEKDESESTEDREKSEGSEETTETTSGSENQNTGGQQGSETSDAEASAAEAKIAKLEAKIARQRAKSDRLREKNDALRAKLQERPKQVRTKGTNLGDYLDEQLGDDDDRTDTIAEISDAADRSIGTITDIISGDGECPDEMTLEAFSEVLDIDYDTLKELAELDGCEFEDAMDDDDDDDDGEEDGADDDDDMSMKEDEASESETETEEEDEDFDEEELENLDAKGIAEFAKGIAELAVKANKGDVSAIRKMYYMSSMFEGSLDDDEDFDEEELENLDAKGIAELAVKANKGDVSAIRKMYYMSGMFEGSFEERQKLIHNNISDYLEYELKLSDSYWVDYTVLATNPNGVDKVLVYSYDKNQVYEVEYEVDGKEINFTSIQSVTLTYQTSSEDMDDEDKASGNGADLVVSDLDPTALAELIQ